jgi:hypothetical protein
MKIKRVGHLPGVLSITLLLLSSCLFTGRPPLELKGNPIQRATEGEFRATLRFMDDETLTAKYKKQANPFFTDYYSAHFRRIMVFELTLENESDQAAQFFLNRVELQYGGTTDTPTNQFQLGKYWEFKDSQRETKAIDISRRENIIKKNVLANSATIPAGGAIRGYLVFLGNTPTYGEAILYIPVFRTEREQLELFTFTYEF